MTSQTSEGLVLNGSGQKRVVPVTSDLSQLLPGWTEEEREGERAPTSPSLPSLCAACGITYPPRPPSPGVLGGDQGRDSVGDYKTTAPAPPPKQRLFQLLFFQRLAPPGVP